VFPAARAADDELADLLRPDSTVRLGVGYLSDDNLRLGPYSGLRAQGAYALGELQVVRRDDASGTWFRASARNLGLRSPEARVELERQGEWGGFVDFSRISRFDPLVITTGLAGIGTSMVTPKGTALREVQLSTERDRFTLGFDRRLLPGVDFQLRYRGESKDGSRLFGRGSGEFLAEPIGSRTHQLEATLGYVGESLQLSGGYYGTAFLNRWAALDVASGVDISLPPDSQSHQLYLSGGLQPRPRHAGHLQAGAQPRHPERRLLHQGRFPRQRPDQPERPRRHPLRAGRSEHEAAAGAVAAGQPALRGPRGQDAALPVHARVCWA
jgi:hypothetical protein